MPMPRTRKSHLLQEASLTWVNNVVDERVDSYQRRPNMSTQPLVCQPILIYGDLTVFMVDIVCFNLDL